MGAGDFRDQSVKPQPFQSAPDFAGTPALQLFGAEPAVCDAIEAVFSIQECVQQRFVVTTKELRPRTVRFVFLSMTGWVSFSSAADSTLRSSKPPT